MNGSLSNLLMMASGFEFSLQSQFDPAVVGMYSYISATSNNYKDSRISGVTFFGLQAFIKQYLSRPISNFDIEEAKKFIVPYLRTFPEEGFRKIVKKYGGYFPVVIKAVPEGTTVGFGKPLVTIECYDPDIFWVVSFLRTAILRAVWYPTSVCTISRFCKKIILNNLRETSDNPEQASHSRLFDIGASSASSHESAILAAMAHLVNFNSTDSPEGLVGAYQYYGSGNKIGTSMPASDYSSVTSWGKEEEGRAHINFLNEFNQHGTYYSCTIDSYDAIETIEKFWGEMKTRVEKSNGTLVLRVNHGDPISTTLRLCKILAQKYGYTKNGRNYKLLKGIRLMWGKGIDPDRIHAILFGLQQNEWSGENVGFAIDDALYQGVTRNTFGFEQNCSMVQLRDGTYRPIQRSLKERVGSLKGFLALRERQKNIYETIHEFEGNAIESDMFVTKFNKLNSQAVSTENIFEIRKRAAQGL